ncbi:hypothetical protein ACT2CC_00130 [Candidatus Vidania fulgoroideorum]
MSKLKIFSFIIRDYLKHYENSVISFGNNKIIDYLFTKNIIDNKKNYIFNSKNLEKKFKNGKKKIYNIDLHIGFISLNLKNFYVNNSNSNYCFENIICNLAKRRIFFLKSKFKEYKFNSELNLYSLNFIKKLKNIGIKTKYIIKKSNYFLSENLFHNELDLILYNFFINKYEKISNSYFVKNEKDIIFYIDDKKIFLNKNQ